MSSETMQRWSSSDAKWEAVIEDYALVNYSASTTRRLIDAANHRTRYSQAGVAKPCKCFPEASNDQLDCCVYEFMPDQGCVLIYADVDDTEPEHKQMLAKKVLTEEPLEEEDIRCAGIRKRSIANLQRLGFPREESLTSEDPRKVVTLHLDNHVFSGPRNLDRNLTRTLFELKSPAERQLFLYMVSRKDRVKEKRPLILLIHMINTEETTMPDSITGYAIGFDVLQGQLIIRSFYSDKCTHPLTSPWTPVDPGDEISFYGTPLEFAHEFFRELPESRDPDLHIKLLVHAHAVKFLLDHWDGLFRTVISSEDAASLRKEVCNLHTKRIEITKAYRFPVKEEFGDITPAVLQNFQDIRNTLLDREKAFKDNALKAKRDDKEKVAENAAKAYEKLMSTINLFIEDPTKEL